MDTKSERVKLAEQVKKLFMEDKSRELKLNQDLIRELLAKITKLKELEKR